MTYEKTQKKKSNFTTDHAITNASLFDFIKGGVNKKTTWQNIIDQIAAVYGLGIRLYETESAMIADTNLSLGDHAIVEENRYALYEVTNVSAGTGDVTLSNGLIAGQQGNIVDNKVVDYTELRALRSTVYADGDIINVTNDGIWGEFVVRTGTVTDNGGTLIVFTDDANRYAERMIKFPLYVGWFGAKGDGVTDDTTSIQAALNVGGHIVIPQTTSEYLFTSLTLTLSDDLIIEGWDASLKCTAPTAINYAIYFGTNQKNLLIKGIKIDVDDNAYQGLAIQQESGATLKDVQLDNVEVSNVYRAGLTFNGGDGIWIRGGYRRVVLNNPIVKGVKLATGAGIPGAAGVFGISILANFAGTLMPRYVEVNNAHIEDIYSEDITYPNDQDGLRMFGITATSIEEGSAIVNGGTFKNCWGRSIKLQRSDCIVSGATFIRDAGNSSGGGNSEIDFQRGGGGVRDIICNYKNFNPVTIVNTYQNADDTYGFLVDGVSVYLENTILAQVVQRFSTATSDEPVSIIVKNVRVIGEITRVLRYLTQNSTPADLHTYATLENINFEQAAYLAQVYGVNTGSTVFVYTKSCVTTGTSVQLIDEGTFSNAVSVRLYEDYNRGFVTSTDSFYTATLTPATSGTITLNPNEERLHYIRKGRLVTIFGQLRITSVSSPVGSITLNLPFNNQIGTQTSSWTHAQISVSGSNTKNMNDFGMEVTTTDAAATIVDISGSAAAAATTELIAGTRLYINFQYVVEDVW